MMITPVSSTAARGRPAAEYAADLRRARALRAPRFDYSIPAELLLWMVNVILGPARLILARSASGWEQPQLFSDEMRASFRSLRDHRD
ncbi:MAG: hypothetical protein ACRDRJ_30840 [Streptosporangiaceae bacterium]